MRTKALIAAAVIISSLSAGVCLAQSSDPPPVGMILFPVKRDQDGNQYIISRAGYKIVIQGAGIAHDAKHIAVYQDNQNNFWYINKKGEPTEVNPEQMAKVNAQIQGQIEKRAEMQGQYPQAAQPGQYQPPYAGQATTNPNQTVIVNQQPSGNTGSGGAGALGTGIAAMGGAMGGAVLGGLIDSSMYNHPYYGMPYGQPMYREANSGRYYYNKGGNNVYVAPNHNTQAMFNQYNAQGAWKDKDQWAHNANWNNANHPNYANGAHPDQPIQDRGRGFENRGEGFREAGGGRRFGGGRFRR